ncbi:MAG TPA: O-antigen ligase family protein [Solirubrobacteraceae bacterium]
MTTGARIEVGLAVVAVLAAIAGLWFGTLRLAAPRLALAGLALLTAFAAWSGVTVLWSVAPDQTWIEVNRALTYVIVLSLAIALGASDPRARDWVVRGFVGVSLAVAAYALGQKLVPGLRIPGLFDLNQTGSLPRLQEPFGYWNALALFVTLGVPAALVLALDRARRRAERITGLVALELLLLVIAFTYSRGAVIALALALALVVGMSRAALRSLMWLGVAALGLLAPLVLGLADHSLTAANVPLGRRESAGAILTLVLLASTTAMVLGALRLMRLEETATVSHRQTKMIGRTLIGAVGVLIVIGILAVTVSSRGLTGTVSHAWHSFTTTRATSVYQPDRLLSVDSENRWVWWREAAGAFGDRPLAGWGAGSFGVVHLLYRRDTLTVNQPHSVPLQFLAETGVVGALLALVGFGLLLAAGIRAVRRLPPGSQRLLAASLLAGAVAYAAHALYDWDWDIPGVTFPAVLMLGVLVAARHPAPTASRATLDPWGAGPRVLALALLTAGLCSFALSAALPSLAATKAANAVVEAAGSSSTAVRHAQSDASLASRLDPLSDAGLRVEATIALRRGDLDQGRRYLLQAIARDPTDGQAWRELAFEELALGNTRNGLLALGRVLALDPHAAGARQLANYIAAIRAEKLTPARDSATAHPVGQS